MHDDRARGAGLAEFDRGLHGDRHVGTGNRGETEPGEVALGGGGEEVDIPDAALARRVERGVHQGATDAGAPPVRSDGHRTEQRALIVGLEAGNPHDRPV